MSFSKISLEGEADAFLAGDAFPSDVFLVGGGLAAFAAALAAATLLAAADGFTGLRAGTAPLSTVAEVGRAEIGPLWLLAVVVVAAFPLPAVVTVMVDVELFALLETKALGLDTRGTFRIVPVLVSVVDLVGDLAAAVGP